MEFIAKVISPLEKVFYDCEIEEFKEYKSSSVLKKSTASFEIAYISKSYSENDYSSYGIYAKAKGPLADRVKIYSIEHVPGVFSYVSFKEPDDYLRTKPGLFPDILIPYETLIEGIRSNPGVLGSLFVEIDTKDAPSGKHDIEIELSDESGNILSTVKHKLYISEKELPKQKLIHTEWMHTDCITDYYNIKVFSKEYWTAVENFIAMYAKTGGNMLYTPIFTPPLDTKVGGERTTVQLVDVEYSDGKYTFGFEKFEKWVGIAKKCGIEYFEMSHLFTQWGAGHAPKIMAKVGGRSKKIFGWETDSHGKEYTEFLEAFLPELKKELKKLKIDGCTFFHISDEPQNEHLENYEKCSNIIRKHLRGYMIMDAMSSVVFYDKKLVDVPIPYIKNSKAFFDKNPQPRFAYYCGAPYKCMGRALAMPSSRTRITGLQLYANDVDGFLFWGFNFYNSARSLRKIDPFFITDADKHFCAGDCFVVYPGDNYKPYMSLRLAVLRDSMQDMQIAALCEELCGKQAVLDVIKKHNGKKDLSMTKIPKDRSFAIKVREELIKLIDNK